MVSGLSIATAAALACSLPRMCRIAAPMNPAVSCSIARRPRQLGCLCHFRRRRRYAKSDQQSSQDAGATFSPDGRFIAFMSDRGGGWAIWVMNTDGSNPQKLIDVPGGFGTWEEERLAWGP